MLKGGPCARLFTVYIQIFYRCILTTVGRSSADNCGDEFVATRLSISEYALRIGALAIAQLATAAPIAAVGAGPASARGPGRRCSAQREVVEGASLSPDGKKLAYITPMKGQGSVLMIVDLVPTPQTPKAILKLDGEPIEIGRLQLDRQHPASVLGLRIRPAGRRRDLRHAHDGGRCGRRGSQGVCRCARAERAYAWVLRSMAAG